MTEHKTLAEALLAFQAEAPTLPKDGNNPHFNSKFTPLDTIVETVQPLLTEHGLTWSTLPTTGPGGEPALRYKLTHAASGESESDVMLLLPPKADPQGMGSALTYARRYSLTAVLNLVADEDDDGNRGSRRERNGGSKQPAPKLLDDTQRNRVLSAIADLDQDEALLFAAVGVSSAEELTVDAAKQIRALLDKVPAASE